MENLEKIIYQNNEEKAKKLIAYITLKSDVGKTKLMKLLYLIDFTMYEKYGKSITNDEYQHWPYGPVPINIWNKVDKDYTNDLLNITKNEHEKGTYYKFTPKNDNINLNDIFSQDEIKVINGIIDIYGNKNQEELVNMVHEEYPYKITSENETIPYFMACYRNYGEAEKIKQKELILKNEKLIEIIKYKVEKYSKSIQFTNGGVSCAQNSI